MSAEATKKIIIFTDLDCTILDFYTYSFEAALSALQAIKEKEIPLILCSSKTRREIEYYRKKLNNSHPFISENGGGIFIPKGYFELEGLDFKLKVKEEKDYHVIRLGVKYSDLRNAIEALRKEGFNVRGFGDMTVEDLADIAHMTIEEAKMAKERDFDEPFIFNDAAHKIPSLLKSINKKGFKFTQGRFFHILGSSNKGVAVSMLIDLYKNKFKNFKTIAIGDSPNDIPMLERVDYPVIVQKYNGEYDPQINIPKIIKAEGIGPEGWNKAVLRLVMEMTVKKPQNTRS